MNGRFWLFLIFLSPALLFGQDYYFVAEKNGRWSDIQNWRTTSGGTIQHSTIPSSSDDIIIDDNSFPGGVKAIIIDLPLATCHSISITTSQAFTFQVNEHNTLNIAGGVTGNPNTNYDFRGDLVLYGAGSKTIDFGQRLNVHKLTIGEVGGEWTISNDFYIENELSISDGTISFEDLRISAGQAIFDPSSDLQASFTGVEMSLRSTDQKIEYGWTNLYTLQFYHAGRITTVADNSIIRISGDYPSISIQGNNFIDWDQLHLTANEYATINYDNITYDATGFRMNSLTIDGNARIYTILDADRVQIEQGSSVELLNGGEFQWNNIRARGTCQEQVSINSGQATINTQNTDIEHAVLINLTFTGNATATESSLVGTTLGITVSQSQSETYYWVNGTGDWSDVNQWSLSSGGPSAGCIPSGKDDVVFDGNSFGGPNDEANIPGNAYVNDISWELPSTGHVLKLEESANLYINGSMIMTQETLFDNQGTIYFLTKDDKVIDAKDSKIDGRVILSGEGTWTLHSPFTSLHLLDFRSGHLILNGYRLKNNRFLSEGDQERTLDISHSHWIHEYASGYPFWASHISRRNFTIITTSSHVFMQRGSQFSFLNPGRMNIAPIVFDSLTVVGPESALVVQDQVLKGSYVNLNANIVFSGEFEFDEVHFTQGHRYEYQGSTKISASEVLVRMECPNSFLFYGVSEAQPVQLYFPTNTKMPGLVAQNIHVVSGNIEAARGIDNGNNQNIEFLEESGRTLYWVGGDGNWIENEHWSLTSGGPGGECMPGPSDNVIFDDQSFFTPMDQVEVWGNYFKACHDILWTSDALSSDFLLDREFNVFGSATFEKTLKPNNYGGIHFMSRDEEDINLHETLFGIIRFKGMGVYNVYEDFAATLIYYNNGYLNIYNSDISGRQLLLHNDRDQSLLLDHSTVTLDHPTGDARLSVYHQDKSLGIENIGDSYIEFLSISNAIYVRVPDNIVHIGKVFFSNPDSDNEIINNFNLGTLGFSYLEVNGNNTFRGYLEADTLIVHPGHHLLFERNTRVKVYDLYRYLGNNCLSSTWRNIAPIPDEINFEVEASTEVLQDHIQMTSITGSSPVDLMAGPNSTNANNSNPGWIFDDQVSGNEETGILGPDLAFCTSLDGLTLNENNVFAATSVTWNETVMEQEYTVTDPGEYRVHLTYTNGCELFDTMQISLLDQIDLDLGEERVLCEGDSAVLTSIASGSNYEVMWNTGSTSDEIVVSTPGQYRVTVATEECEISDSVQVEVVPSPDLDLPSLVDTARCEGDPIELDLSHLGSVVVWQGDTVRGPISINSSGQYHARVLAGSCFDDDEVTINFYPPPEYTIQQPSPVCEGEAVDIGVSSPSNYIRWEDGSDEFSRTVAPVASRYYLFELRSSVCTLKDSVQVRIHPVPVTNLLYEKDFLCEGEELLLEASSTGDRLEWSDGSTGEALQVDQPGQYFVKSYLGMCSDSMSVDIERVERVNLGLPSDTLICDDEKVVLSSPVSQLEDIQWNGVPGSAESSFTGGQMVVLKALFRGCPMADSTIIRTQQCGPSEIALPNAFSPNGDGQNDTYLPVYDQRITIHEYQMIIFDRWGNVIFSTNSPDEPWTGRESIKAPKGLEGVYGVVLEMKYTNLSDRMYKYEGSGDVMVVR